MASSLLEGDAPCVRDLLLEHFRDPHLEIEGKLGRRSEHKFTAGLSVEQFRAIEAQLLAGAPQFGLLARPKALVEDTVDHFYAEPQGQEHSELQPATHTNDAGKGAPNRRSSFTCNEAGGAQGEAFESIFKIRLSDCHVSAASGGSAPPEDARVDIRVSFSREVPAQGTARQGALVYRRRKRRQTFEAPLYRVQLTHVDVMDGNDMDSAAAVARKRELFEVEVELRMEVVRPRLEEASNAADEALRITRELVAALRFVASVGVLAKTSQKSKKRKRQEDRQALEPAVRLILEEAAVREELHRLAQDAVERRSDLCKAKVFLCNVLKSRRLAVDDSELSRIAGNKIGQIFCRVRGEALAAADATASQAGGA